jgi:hypothetical protein
MEQPADQRGDAGQCPALVLIPPVSGRALAQFGARSRVSCAWFSLHPEPPGPFEARAAPPPARHRRRHWQTDLVLTRSSRATTTGCTSCSNISAASNRTASRRAPRSRQPTTVGISHDVPA